MRTSDDLQKQVNQKWVLHPFIVFKPIYIHITVHRFPTLRKESEHHASKAADGFSAEESVLHLCQLGEVGTIPDASI